MALTTVPCSQTAQTDRAVHAQVADGIGSVNAERCSLATSRLGADRADGQRSVVSGRAHTNEQQEQGSRTLSPADHVRPRRRPFEGSADQLQR